MQSIVFAKKFEINKRWTEKVEISVSILSLVRSGFFWCVEVEAQDKNQITRQLTHEKVEAWMTRCTFPHLSFWMQKYFYYCEISRVILLLQLQQLILQERRRRGRVGYRETASNLDDLLTKQDYGTLWHLRCKELHKWQRIASRCA